MVLDQECGVCFGPCHSPTHEATLRVHKRLRQHMKRILAPPEPPKIDKSKPRKFEPKAAARLREPPAVPPLRQSQPTVWRKRVAPKAPTRKILDNDEIRRLHAEGKNITEMRAILKCAHSPIYLRMQEMGLKFERPVSRVSSGDVYGQLTVRHLLRSDPKRGRIFLCSCTCGNENAEVPVKRLRTDIPTSCGCQSGAWRKKAESEVVRMILADAQSGLYSMSEVARRNGVSRTQVGRLLERDRKEKA